MIFSIFVFAVVRNTGPGLEVDAIRYLLQVLLLERLVLRLEQFLRCLHLATPLLLQTSQVILVLFLDALVFLQPALSFPLKLGLYFANLKSRFILAARFESDQ